jgi:hypothetical protein
MGSVTHNNAPKLISVNPNSFIVIICKFALLSIFAITCKPAFTRIFADFNINGKTAGPYNLSLKMSIMLHIPALQIEPFLEFVMQFG